MSSVLPILADSDIGQVVVFLVVAVVAVVQWLIKLLKEKMEEAGRSPKTPTDEEAEARYRAWEEQTRPVPPPIASPVPPGGMLDDLMGELRKAIEPAREHRTPPRPPRLPDATPAAMPRPLAPQVSAGASEPAKPGPLQTLRADREPHPLTALLRTEGGYRQAFVLREVLGPPRALHEYAGPD
jgi:hypothetical protein